MVGPVTKQNKIHQDNIANEHVDIKFSLKTKVVETIFLLPL